MMPLPAGRTHILPSPPLCTFFGLRAASLVTCTSLANFTPVKLPCLSDTVRGAA